MDKYDSQFSQFSVSIFSYCISVSHFSVSFLSVSLSSISLFSVSLLSGSQHRHPQLGPGPCPAYQMVLPYFKHFPDISSVVFTAIHTMQARSSNENSVCLSNMWIVTERKKDLSRFLYYKKDYLA